MEFATPLDRRIYKSIRKQTKEHPINLIGILFNVDSVEKMVLSYEELSGGLQRLIAAGYVAEGEPHQYYEGTDQDSFTGLSESDYETAVADYHRSMAEAIASINLDDVADRNSYAYGWPRVSLRYATPGERFPEDEDEDQTDLLAEAIDPILIESGIAEINGFEFHSSGSIDVLIWGGEDNADTDKIYELVAPTFRAFDCPPSSRIIRFYHEPEERQVESDIVE